MCAPDSSPTAGLITSSTIAGQPSTYLAGTQFLPGGATAPFAAGNFASNAAQSGGDGVDLATIGALVPGVKRSSAFTHLTFDLTDDAQLFGQALYGHSFWRTTTHRRPARSTAAGPRRFTATTPSCRRRCARSWRPNDSFKLGRSGDLDYGADKDIEQNTEMFSFTTGSQGTHRRRLALRRVLPVWPHEVGHHDARCDPARPNLSRHRCCRHAGWPHRLSLHAHVARRWLRTAEPVRRGIAFAGGDRLRHRRPHRSGTGAAATCDRRDDPGRAVVDVGRRRVGGDRRNAPARTVSPARHARRPARSRHARSRRRDRLQRPARRISRRLEHFRARPFDEPARQLPRVGGVRRKRRAARCGSRNSRGCSISTAPFATPTIRAAVA